MTQTPLAPNKLIKNVKCSWVPLFTFVIIKSITIQVKLLKFLESDIVVDPNGGNSAVKL